MDTKKIAAPLFVDLDGTLIKTDLLHEGILRVIKKSPLYIFLLPFWLLRGIAHLKQQVASIAEPIFSILPANNEFIKFLQQQKLEGRRLYLATASNIIYAEKVALHFNLFDGVIASDSNTNLKGKVKGERCKNISDRFAYAGNDLSDFKIFNLAEESYLVNPNKQALKKSINEPVTRIWLTPKPGVKVWLKAMRLHQWLKNILIFVPLLTAHAYNSIENITFALLGF